MMISLDTGLLLTDIYLFVCLFSVVFVSFMHILPLFYPFVVAGYFYLTIWYLYFFRAAKGTTMCVMAKTNNCTNLDNISGGKNVSQIMDELSAYCPDMEDSIMAEMEGMEDKEEMKLPTEKQCHLLEPMAPCTTVITPCFNNSYTPSSLCRFVY